MRIAALYDIHGNLPALEAVLADVSARGVDLVVVGGDVVAGPRPVETLDRLTAHAAGLLRPASAEEASRHFEAVSGRA